MLENQQLSFPTPKTGNNTQLKELLVAFQDDLSFEAANIIQFLFCYQELFSNLDKLLTSNSPEIRKKVHILSEQTQMLTEELNEPAKIKAGMRELGLGLTNLAQHILAELPVD